MWAQMHHMCVNICIHVSVSVLHACAWIGGDNLLARQLVHLSILTKGEMKCDWCPQPFLRSLTAPTGPRALATPGLMY